jgi:predicted Zn-dependent protease
MKGVLPVYLALIIGFVCLSMEDTANRVRISLSEALPFSVEKERELGEKVAVEIEKQMEVIRDPAIQGYIAVLGEGIVSRADRSEFPIRFAVLNESQPNAFAIPGGRIYITSGLIGLVEREGELAGVMSHEVAHVVRRHVAQRIDASKRINIATLAAVLAGALVGGQEGGAIMAGSLAMGQSQILKYTRENESEADRLGLAYMTRAGYDGHDMASFFKKIARTPEYNTAFPSYLSTHPGVPERISYLETLKEDLPNSAAAHESQGRLEEVQLRVLILEKGPLEAVEYFSNRLEVRPDDEDALFGRALAEKEMGRIEDSIEDLKTAHTLKPTDPEILKELGLAFIRSGRVNEGVRALERSLSLGGKDAETLYYLAQGYQAQKKLDNAIESYLRARALSSGFPDLDRDLASAYKEKGEMGRSHYHYGLYFKRTGQLKYATFHFEKARDLIDQDGPEAEEIARELKQLRK